MEHLPQAELAQRAALDVATVAGNLQAKWRGSLFKNDSKQKRIKNLAILTASLTCFSFCQDKYEPGGHKDQQDEEVQLETFLRGLELYPTNYLAKLETQEEPSARFPTLSALVTAISTQTIQSASDISIVDQVEKSVKKFVSESDYITSGYFAFLKSFFKVEDQAKRHAESAQRDPESQLDEDESYPRHVYDTLYKVINKYLVCCCGLPNVSSKTPKRHWGRLELQANFGPIENEIPFHTVFSKRGSCEYDENIEWRHLQIRVPSGQRAVKFEDEKGCGDVQNEARRDAAPNVVSTSELCKFFGRDIGTGSRVARIRNETLHSLECVVEIEVDIANGKSISLSDVLSNYSLVPKTKLVLAYILAKSFWQFYDSDFMDACWTTKSIHLFREREDGDNYYEPGVDWAPYYAFSLEQMTERGSMERLPAGHFVHRYPRVLALGAILYELGQEKRWEKQATLSGPASPTNDMEPPTLERLINDTSYKIRRGVQREEWPDIKLKNIQTLEDYRVIVANCASQNFFRLGPMEKPPNSPKHSLQKTAEELEEELTVSERRAILFKKVVAPLKKIVQTTGWVDESGKIQRYSVQGATTRLRGEEPYSETPRSEALLEPSQSSQEFRAPSRDIAGNDFGHSTVIHQGDNHYYSTYSTR